MHTAIYGGSFNPPGHHVTIVERLLEQFAYVRVRPCGMRRDKISVNAMLPVHRRAMAELAFGDLGERVVLDFSDLDAGKFTPSYKLIEEVPSDVMPWLVVGSDLIQGGRSGESPIQREWQQGEKLWRTAYFVITEREGYLIQKGDCPPMSIVIGPPLPGASKDLRDLIQSGRSITGLVPRAVEAYIHQHGLYR